jgi:hypothetical protein
MTRFRKFLLGLALSIGLAAVAAGVLPSQPAQPASAWAWSSTVTIQGQLTGCGWGLQTAYVSGVLNGQYHSYNAPLGQPPSYRLTFTNVPSGYSWAWVVVNCSVAPSYGRWVHMYRPAWGDTLTVNL